jgi:hypothetical protein
MSNIKYDPSATNHVLVKVRPSIGLRAAEGRVNLRPLYDTPQAKGAVLGIGAEPQWFLAELPEGAVTPWDLAHGRISAQLGVSPSDVVFAEPDLFHNVYPDTSEERAQSFAVGQDCEANRQDGSHGKALGPEVFAWHLGDEYMKGGTLVNK